MRSPARATCVEPGVQPRADLRPQEGMLNLGSPPPTPSQGAVGGTFSRLGKLLTCQRSVITPHRLASRSIGYLSTCLTSVKGSEWLFKSHPALNLHAGTSREKPLPHAVQDHTTTKARPCRSTVYRYPSISKIITPAGLSIPFQGRKNILTPGRTLSSPPEDILDFFLSGCSPGLAARMNRVAGFSCRPTRSKPHRIVSPPAPRLAPRSQTRNHRQPSTKSEHL